MAQTVGRDLSPTAKRILRYLTNRPEAADSVAGIAEWWLMRDTIETALSEVRGALGELMDAGLVSETGGIGRATSYRIDPGALDRAREIVDAAEPPKDREDR
jgi:hypothetical protein